MGLPGVSATSLQSYYQCSLYWLYKRVFNLQNEQIETTMMDANISGSVYHIIFNMFFSELKNNKKPLSKPLSKPVQSSSELSLPSDYKELLNNCINTVFNNLPVLEPEKGPEMSSLTARMLHAAKKEFHFNLKNFIAHFLSYFAGCTVVNCEKYYQAERELYILKGYIDLLIKDPLGNYIIVDFKLKYTPPRKDCTGDGENGLSNFQLPAYITLVEEKEHFKVYTALFYSILNIKPEVIFGTICDINTEKVIPHREEDRILYDSERYRKIFEEFNKKTERFASDISSGNLTVIPNNNINCYSCDYHRICRTAYVIERENIKGTSKKNF